VGWEVAWLADDDKEEEEKPIQCFRVVAPRLVGMAMAEVVEANAKEVAEGLVMVETAEVVEAVEERAEVESWVASWVTAVVLVVLVELMEAKVPISGIRGSA